MSNYIKETIEIESYYKKTPNGVFYYWRIVGTDIWNIAPTGLKELPTYDIMQVELKDQRQNNG